MALTVTTGYVGANTFDLPLTQTINTVGQTT
jgi:hypothetical protein